MNAFFKDTKETGTPDEISALPDKVIQITSDTQNTIEDLLRTAKPLSKTLASKPGTTQEYKDNYEFIIRKMEASAAAAGQLHDEAVDVALTAGVQLGGK